MVPIHAVLLFRRDARAAVRAGGIQGRVNLFKIELATGRHWYSCPAMTIETTTSIQPKDITAVEFECRKCGAKTIRKLNADFQPPGICGNCSELWFTDGSERHHELREFFARFIFQL